VLSLRKSLTEKLKAWATFLSAAAVALTGVVGAVSGLFGYVSSQQQPIGH
jgi:hypothetical protein